MDYRDFNIEVNTTKTTGEYHTTCPQCSHTRKKKKDKCLSVNLDKQVWFCSHCQWKGSLNLGKIQEVIYEKPEWKNKTNLSAPCVKWFEQRGISQKTLNELKVSEGMEWMPQVSKEMNTVQFNYFRKDDLINVKYRTGNKHFKLFKGAELIFYNIDSIVGENQVIICEGEIDAMSFIEAGYKFAISVPNGANSGSNNLQYIDNCIDLFDKIETIYLATDNDINGRKLRQELSERFGVDRCKYIEFKSFKDCNDLLKHEGIIGVKEVFESAKDFPLEGVFTIQDLENDINDMYVNGLDNGVDTGMTEFDELLKFTKGYITTVTGIPGHGKSDFVDQVAIKLFLRHKWRFAFYSPENKPTRLHFSKLARKMIGKQWFGVNRINTDELEIVKSELNSNFWFIKPEKDFTLDSILLSVKQLKKTRGIEAFVIDAWNKLEHKYTQSETKYIGESLDKIAVFCEENNVHCFLVAHPTKTAKKKDSPLYEVPNLYSIAGSANFYNKTDNGISVYRNFENNTTEVYVQKVKFSHWGKVGVCEFKYCLDSGRFKKDLDDDFHDWIRDKYQRQERIEMESKELPKTGYRDAFGEKYNENDEIQF